MDRRSTRRGHRSEHAELAGRSPQDRYGKNAYTLDEYGLTVEELAPIFADYLEAFDIELEGAQ